MGEVHRVHADWRAVGRHFVIRHWWAGVDTGCCRVWWRGNTFVLKAMHPKELMARLLHKGSCISIDWHCRRREKDL